MVGVGWGFGRGHFDNGPVGEGIDVLADEVYRNGSVPQIHVGWKASKRFMLGAHYEAWMLEFGAPPEKYRRSMQNLALGLTWFPGNPLDASGGIFLRAGGGVGWAGTAEVPVEEDVAQTHGERLDEWGVSVFGNGGYEFWISRNATLGASLSVNYVDIGADIVDTGWFTAGIVNLSLYF